MFWGPSWGHVAHATSPKTTSETKLKKDFMTEGEGHELLVPGKNQKTIKNPIEQTLQGEKYTPHS